MTDIAVILPCLNEEAAIGPVVAAFRAALPSAVVYVYDNASTDDTAGVASRAGAIVRREPTPGKGNAVTRAFADIDADIYVVADGDGTYDAKMAPVMIERLQRETLDMVIGVRAHSSAAAYRPGHVMGNRVFSGIFRSLFRVNYTDILSGYRVLSRRFVKSFPSRARGFEIEIEMSAHAALLRTPLAEIETTYGPRPKGAQSKLNTFADGARILARMFRFLRLHRPRFVYGLLGIFGVGAAAIFFIPILIEFLQTGLVPRFPTLIVSVAIGILGCAAFAVGAILDAQAQHFAETKRLAYLRMAPPPGIAT
ncbi:MAG: glycosyltransferase [Parvularculaceae bacterium]|nr:glycosyltransferase [Parvularculaceae bacterium]